MTKKALVIRKVGKLSKDEGKHTFPLPRIHLGKRKSHNIMNGITVALIGNNIPAANGITVGGVWNKFYRTGKLRPKSRSCTSCGGERECEKGLAKNGEGFAKIRGITATAGANAFYRAKHTGVLVGLVNIPHGGEKRDESILESTGLTLGGLFNEIDQMYGVAIAGIGNDIHSEGKGIVIGGLGNDVGKTDGIVMGGVVNYGSCELWKRSKRNNSKWRMEHN